MAESASLAQKTSTLQLFNCVRVHNTHWPFLLESITLET